MPLNGEGRLKWGLSLCSKEKSTGAPAVLQPMLLEKSHKLQNLGNTVFWVDSTSGKIIDLTVKAKLENFLEGNIGE